MGFLALVKMQISSGFETRGVASAIFLSIWTFLHFVYSLDSFFFLDGFSLLWDLE
jgi:hypothetical protein